MSAFAWLESTALSIWLRESVWGFFAFLTLHSLAMGVVIGISIALALRVLGLAAQAPLRLMDRFLPFMWGGVVVIFISGVFLLLAYPAKALTNWVFYLKLVCVVLALMTLVYLQRHFVSAKQYELGPLPRRAKSLATLILLLWIVSITAGRFLAYTHTVLLTGL